MGPTAFNLYTAPPLSSEIASRIGLRLSVFMTWLYARTRTPLFGRYATSSPLLLLGRRVFRAGVQVLPPSRESDRSVVAQVEFESKGLKPGYFIP
jgi:hypothetical protein